MSHFMSEKKHYQENADSVEEMLSNFTNSNGSTGEIKNGLILPTGQWYAPSAVINVAKM